MPRDSVKEEEVLPFKDGEVLAVHHQRYSKQDDKEPPLFLAEHSTPDVDLYLASAPKTLKNERE